MERAEYLAILETAESQINNMTGSQLADLGQKCIQTAHTAALAAESAGVKNWAEHRSALQHTQWAADAIASGNLVEARQRICACLQFAQNAQLWSAKPGIEANRSIMAATIQSLFQ